MERYLSEIQLKANLNIGKSVEQWLSANDIDGYTVIKWLAIEKEKDETYSVIYIESFDEGDEDFVDVSEFSTVDPDNEFGIITTFSTKEKAINFSISSYHASIN